MSELWQLILGKMFWALGICWKYWVITLNLDVFNPLRPMKAKILKLVIKYSHSEDIIRQFLCGSRLFRSLFYLSHNFLWEISHILRFDKARPCIGAFLYKSSNDQGFVRDAVYSNPWLPVKLLIRYGSVSYSFSCKKEFIIQHKNMISAHHLVALVTRENDHGNSWTYLCFQWARNFIKYFLHQIRTLGTDYFSN